MPPEEELVFQKEMSQLSGQTGAWTRMVGRAAAWPAWLGTPCAFYLTLNLRPVPTGILQDAGGGVGIQRPVCSSFQGDYIQEIFLCFSKDITLSADG